MIKINSPEEFARWLAEMPTRSPKAFERLSGAGIGLSVAKKAIPAAPIKESKDFTEAVDDQWDGIEP